MTMVTLDLDGLSCASCVARAEKAMAAVPGVSSVSINLALESAQVNFLEDTTDAAQIAAASKAAGYPATLANGTINKDEDRSHLTRMVWIAAVLTLPVFIMEMGGHLYPPLHHAIARTIGTQTAWVIQFVLTTAVLIWPGRMFFVKGVPALWRRAPDMNALVAVGTFAAWAYSTVATFLPSVLPDGTRNVYFEAAAVIVTLILLGRLMEARAKGRAGQAIRALIGLQPKEARVMRGDDWAVVPVSDIVVGDVVALPPGARVATDGVVTSGTSFVDESMMSGEPMPVAKTAGDTVIGGTVNGTGALQFHATSVGAQTMLAQIIALVQTAQGAKLPVQDAINRVTAVFVPVVMVIAGLTVAAWLIWGPDPAFALVAGVAVLIVACPCAMGLAVPTSIMVGSGRAAQLGVLFRKGTALQTLRDVQTVAFDKTGTLTQGRPALVSVDTIGDMDADAVLAIAATVETVSEHPLARAIVDAALSKGLAVTQPQDFNAHIGYGVVATVDGATVHIGTARFLEAQGIVVGHVAAQVATPVYVAIDGALQAVLWIADPLKPEARDTIAALHGMGLRTALITGDTDAVARSIGAEIGITQIVSQVLPAGKVNAVTALGDGVVFVGDGINDGPALATADVGIAIGTGTDVAMESADVVLMSGDLRGVVTAIDVSQRVMRNIRQNLFWAFAYNAALIPVAAGLLYPFTGTLLSPMLAAGAMALSSVFVVSNALRLQWIAPREVAK